MAKDDPLAAVKDLLSQLSDAVDALEPENSDSEPAEGEPAEAPEAAPKVAVSLPWRGKKPAAKKK